jgi:hypothetical protein
MNEPGDSRRAGFRDTIPVGIGWSIALWLVFELATGWLLDVAPGLMLSLGLLALSVVAIFVAALFYTFRN